MPATENFRAAGRIVVVLCTLLGGCGYHREVGLGERCGDFMRQAYPGAHIEITEEAASAAGLNAITAKVSAERRDMPANDPLPRHLAVTCRFDEGVLTGFHWTAGPMR
jgi:hypothetical protein